MTAPPKKPNHSITVYSKPGCVQCHAVMRALAKAGVTHKIVDVTQDAEGLAAIKAMGYTQAPIILWVDANGFEHHRYGFVPDFIKRAVADLQVAA